MKHPDSRQIHCCVFAGVSVRGVHQREEGNGRAGVGGWGRKYTCRPGLMFMTLQRCTLARSCAKRASQKLPHPGAHGRLIIPLC